ncbi:MAG: TPM domain-containing protein [Candidatus Pacebacteria bacterium]|nr:TPM domain-containing protein [Candidatus Paceibacterota bacterium]
MKMYFQLILLCISFSVSAQDTLISFPELGDDTYLYDEASMFSEQELLDAQQYLQRFKNNSEISFRVIVIDSLARYGVDTKGTALSRARHNNLGSYLYKLIGAWGLYEADNQIFFILSTSDRVFDLKYRSDLIDPSDISDIKKQNRNYFLEGDNKEFLNSVTNEIVSLVNSTIAHQREIELWEQRDKIYQQELLEQERLQQEIEDRESQESLDKFLTVLKYVGIGIVVLVIIVFLYRVIFRFVRFIKKRLTFNRKLRDYGLVTSKAREIFDELSGFKFDILWAQQIYTDILEKLQNSLHSHEKILLELRNNDPRDSYSSYDYDFQELRQLFENKRQYLIVNLPKELKLYELVQKSYFDLDAYLVKAINQIRLLENNTAYRATAFFKRIDEIKAPLSEEKGSLSNPGSFEEIHRKIQEWDQEIQELVDTAEKNAELHRSEINTFRDLKQKFDYLPVDDAQEKSREQAQKLISDIKKFENEITDKEFEKFSKLIERFKKVMEKLI